MSIVWALSLGLAGGLFPALDGAGAGAALATAGAGELAFGYAKLSCAEPAVARLLLVRESGGVPAALANQESARAAHRHRFPLPPRLGRFGLVLANDGDAAAACAVELGTAAGVFTVLGGAVPEADAETPARHVLPLVLDGGGFRSRLEVANRAATANRCELAFRGAGLNNARFPDIAGVAKDGFRRAAFELPPDGRVALTSLGRSAYAARGHAALECEGPARAHVLPAAANAAFAAVPPVVQGFRHDPRDAEDEGS